MMKKLLSIALIALILASCVHESPFRSEYYFQAMGRSGEIVITVDTRESGILSGFLPDEIHGRADRISVAIDGEGNVYGGAEGNFGYAGVNALLDWVPEFRKIVGYEWNPGLNAPFDPIASGIAEENGMTVIAADGRNIENTRAILEGKPFEGTVICP